MLIPKMTIRSLFSTVLPLLIILCYQQLSHAQVYKWQDENGQIHYTDQPNHPKAESFSVRKNTTTKPRTPASTPDDKTAQESSTDNSAKDEKNTNTDQDNKPKMVEIEPSYAEKNRYCNEAKSDIAAITSRGRMREINEKGEYIYLSEQQRQQRLAAAKKKKREFCR